MKKLLIVLTTLLLTLGIVSFCYAVSGEDGTPAQEDGTVQEIIPSALIAGKCGSTPKVDYAVADDSLTTSSQTFVDVTGMSVTFKIPALTPRSCVRVEFSAFTFTSPNELMFIRAFLDGTTEGAPGPVQFDGDSDEDGDIMWARSRAFNFLFTDVKAGAHTITIQWRSSGGTDVFLHKRTMFVHHK